MKYDVFKDIPKFTIDNVNVKCDGAYQSLPLRVRWENIKIVTDEELELGVSFDHVFNDYMFKGITPISLYMESPSSLRIYECMIKCITDEINNKTAYYLPEDMFKI